LEDGVWTNVSDGAPCGAAADFNGDGKPDLAAAVANGISILLGTGKAATPFTPGKNIALVGASCPLTGDLNGDGIVDLLVPDSIQQTVVAYLGNGDGAFTLKSTTPTPLGGSVVEGDFNHDGKVDFATSGNLIALGNGDGTFQNPTYIVANPPSLGFSGIAAGDINNDGWPDLVLTSGVTTIVLLNNRRGGFTQIPTTFDATYGQPILADLNGDGNLDLVVQSTTPGSALVYVGDGKGIFTFQVELSSPMRISGTNLVADINGDRIPDIMMLQMNTVTVYLGQGGLGQGGATYGAPFSIGAGPDAASILVENLHGQSPEANLPDIVVPDYLGVMVLLNLTPY